jgi:surfactin synthase thioesterase subunit
MGSLIAYELAQQLQQMGQPPTHLFVSARRAPYLPELDALLHTIASDDAFLAELQRRYNNLPAVLFEEPELRELFVPLLRADFALVERYQWREQPPLSCPIVAFGGEGDDRASMAELMAWARLTAQDFALHRFPGGHFYLNEQRQPLLGSIAGYLREK